MNDQPTPDPVSPYEPGGVPVPPPLQAPQPGVVPGSLAAAAQSIGAQFNSVNTFQTRIPQTSTLAIFCLIAAIAGWTFAPVLATIVALVLGSLAKSEIEASNGLLGGRELVTVGMIIAWIQVGLIALVVLVVLLLIFASILFGTSGRH